MINTIKMPIRPKQPPVEIRDDDADKKDDDKKLKGEQAMTTEATDWKELLGEELGEEDTALIEQVLVDTGLSFDELMILVEEDEERVERQYELFNAIIDDKPHDAKEALNTIVKDRLEDSIDEYKAYVAQHIFNAPPYDDEEEGEEEWEDEGGAVKEDEDQVDEMEKMTYDEKGKKGAMTYDEKSEKHKHHSAGKGKNPYMKNMKKGKGY